MYAYAVKKLDQVETTRHPEVLCSVKNCLCNTELSFPVKAYNFYGHEISGHYLVPLCQYHQFSGVVEVRFVELKRLIGVIKCL